MTDRQFRGSLGFTPTETRIVAVVAAVVLVASGIAIVRRAIEPAPRVVRQTIMLDNPVADTSLTTADMPTERLPGSAYDADGQLDLNRADFAELVKLPGIGPVLAGRIMEFRQQRGPFRAVDSLLAVNGIGRKKLAMLYDLVFVAGDGTP